MILGIGIDIMDIRRIERDFAGYASRFTAAERALCEGRAERMAAYTKRFAAKEACIKALGGNDVLGGVRFHEIEVVPTKSGRPTLELTGGALRQLAAITPPGYEPRIHVSVSDYFPFAVAQVTIEAHPKREGAEAPPEVDIVCA